MVTPLAVLNDRWSIQLGGDGGGCGGIEGGRGFLLRFVGVIGGDVSCRLHLMQ